MATWRGLQLGMLRKLLLLCAALTSKACDTLDGACGADVTALLATSHELHKGVRNNPAVSVLVSSVGGVGTTSIMKELEMLRPPVPINAAYDRDGMKHKPYSRVIQFEPFQSHTLRKILYLHGDPVHALLSLSRRGYLLEQMKKTRTDPLPETLPTTLEEYARIPTDMLQLEQHFDSFFHQCDYPVAFLRVEEKTLHLKALAAFLEVPKKALREHLVPWSVARRAEIEAEDELLEANTSTVSEERILERARRLVESYAKGPEARMQRDPHEYQTVPQEIRENLEAKFRRLRKKYDALPGFKVYQPSDCKTRRLPIVN